MDGFYGGNPIKMDDLGVPLFLETSTLHHTMTGAEPDSAVETAEP